MNTFTFKFDSKEEYYRMNTNGVLSVYGENGYYIGSCQVKYLIGIIEGRMNLKVEEGASDYIHYDILNIGLPSIISISISRAAKALGDMTISDCIWQTTAVQTN